MKFFKDKKGFTLVELVVVIAILGILGGIAIPRFMDATETARGAKIIADLRTVDSASAMYYAKEGSYPADTDALVTAKFFTTAPTIQAGDAQFPSNPGISVTITAGGIGIGAAGTAKEGRAYIGTDTTADELSAGGTFKANTLAGVAAADNED